MGLGRLAAASMFATAMISCSPSPQHAGGRAPDGREAAPAIPYVVIRQDKPDIVFEDALYSALVRALERYPDARFDVVLALPPLREGANARMTLARGERQIEDVVWAMTDMGLPAERLYIAARTDETSDVNEIRIFVH